MTTISVRNLNHHADKPRVHSEVTIPHIGTVYDSYLEFSGDLKSGDVTCISGNIGDGTTGVIYTLTGMDSAASGEILLGSQKLVKRDLAQMGCLVYHDYSVVSWYKKRTTVRRQLIEALSIGNDYRITDIEQLKTMLGLSEERLDRPLYQCSNERWRATIAIGLAQGKRLFAFPWMNPNFVKSYLPFWLGRSLDVLRELDAWIIVATSDPQVFNDHVDNVLPVKGCFHVWDGA